MSSDVGKSLRTKLLSYTGVSDLIGTRMEPDALTQGSTLPAIVYHKISTAREHTLLDVTRLAHSRIEIMCYGATRDEANNVAHAIRKSGIGSFQGTVDGVYFCGVEFDSGDQYENEPPSNGNQVHRYITTFDLMVHYQEAD